MIRMQRNMDALANVGMVRIARDVGLILERLIDSCASCLFSRHSYTCLWEACFPQALVLIA